MEKILAILTRQNDFGRELASILTAKAGQMLKIPVFTDILAYSRYESVNRVDMLLCEQELAQQCSGGFSARNLCLLSEVSSVEEDMEGPRTIFKYQSAEKLAVSILACLKEGSEQCGDKADIAVSAIKQDSMEQTSELVLQRTVPGCCTGNVRLIGVSTPLGDRKSSTYALALAEFYAEKGRTLFISLDPFYLFPWGAAGGNVSELIYRLQTESEGIATFLEEKAVKPGKAECFCGMTHWLDREDMTAEHARKLALACQSGKYATVVVDTGHVGSAQLALLGFCSDIYVPRSKGKRDSEVIAAWKNQMELSEGGSIANRLVERIIPYDPLLAGEFEINDLLKNILGGYIKETEVFGYNR